MSEMIAVFGTNRTFPTFVYFDIPVQQFEYHLEHLIDTALSKKQALVNVDPKTAFWIDDFYENVPVDEKDPKKGTKRVRNLYKRMRVITLAEYNASLRYRQTFIMDLK